MTQHKSNIPPARHPKVRSKDVVFVTVIGVLVLAVWAVYGIFIDPYNISYILLFYLPVGVGVGVFVAYVAYARQQALRASLDFLTLAFQIGQLIENLRPIAEGTKSNPLDPAEVKREIKETTDLIEEIGKETEKMLDKLNSIVEAIKCVMLAGTIVMLCISIPLIETLIGAAVFALSAITAACTCGLIYLEFHSEHSERKEIEGKIARLRIMQKELTDKALEVA